MEADRVSAIAGAGARALQIEVVPARAGDWVIAAVAIAPATAASAAAHRIAAGSAALVVAILARVRAADHQAWAAVVVGVGVAADSVEVVGVAEAVVVAGVVVVAGDSN